MTAATLLTRSEWATVPEEYRYTGADGRRYVLTRDADGATVLDPVVVVDDLATPPDCPRTLCLFHPGVPVSGQKCFYQYRGTVPMTGPQACVTCGNRKGE